MIAVEEQPQHRFGVLTVLFGSIVLAIVNVAVTLIVLDMSGNLGRQEIVSIDAADLIKGFVAAQGPDVSDDELQARIRALNANIDPLIRAYAAERNLLVVNAAAVLGGVRDVTPDLLHQTGLVQ
jgi:hypothetical protein